MKENGKLRSAAELMTTHYRHSKWLKAVTAMAAVVVFCTVYALMLPVVALDSQTYCGIEEHTHGEGCYEQKLVCGQEEGETAGHVHTDECYETETVLVCGEEESEEHTHTEDCYEEQQTLICGMEEGEGATSHTHSDECYESVLTCEQEEHTHSLACHSNPEADVETAEKWGKSVSKVELTGNWAEDLVAIAKTQLGYAESTKNYEVAADGETKMGYTRYGVWYGDEYGDWDAMFVSFCLNYAEVSTKYVPQSGNCEDWIAMLSGETKGYEDFDLYQSADSYTPVSGDLIFLDLDKDGKADRAGIVAEYTETNAKTGEKAEIKAIIGDFSEGEDTDSVQSVTYDADSEKIVGYARLPENPDAEKETDPADGNKGGDTSANGSASDASAGGAEERSVSCTVDGVTFTATGALPEDTRLVVKALSDEQTAAIGEKFDDVTLSGTAYAYDIKLVDGNGEELELGESIHVSVSGLELPEGADVTGYHLTDVDADTLDTVDAESVEVEKLSISEEKDGISYDTDGFSVYIYDVSAASEWNGGELPATVTGVEIKTFKVRFVSGATKTQSDQVTDAEGNTEEAGKYYVWTPGSSASGHSFIYRVDYTLGGVAEIEPGQLQITLPLHILKDKDGDWADTFDCPYLSEDEVSEDDDPDFLYRVNEEDNTVTIYNVKSIGAGTSGYIEFAYATTEPTPEYFDMRLSDQVTAKIKTTEGDKEAWANGVAINTHATISSTQKKQPTQYTSWQSSWGTAPADADEYYYLVWPIYTKINKATSYFNFTLTDTFSDYGGSVVAIRFSGTSTWVAADANGSATKENVKSSTERYDYVLVKYKISEVEEALGLQHSSTLENGGITKNYTVKNTVTATVDPVDQVDEDTSATSSAQWAYEVPTFVHPTGHFWADKYGVFGTHSMVLSEYDETHASDNHYTPLVMDSDDISSYDLAEFLSGEDGGEDYDAITQLQYFDFVRGYPYPWTYDTSLYTGTESDAYLYGKKAVTYVLSDDKFKAYALTYNDDLGVSIGKDVVELESGDYDITKLMWNVDMDTATYNSTTKKFESSALSTTDTFQTAESTFPATENDLTPNTLYFYVTTATGKEADDDVWVLAATYNLSTGKYGDLDSTYVSATKNDSNIQGTITFKTGVYGYKIVTSNAYYHTQVNANPVVSLNRTDHVAQILTGNSSATADDLAALEKTADGQAILSKIAVRNTAEGYARQNRYKSDSNPYGTIFSRTSAGTDYVSQTVRDSSLTKTVTSTRNNKSKRNFTITWRTTLKETYVDDEGEHYTPQESGTFYDLIPAGGTVDTSSIKVYASGSVLSSGEYTYEVVENYDGSGRQMLIVHITEPTTSTYVLNCSTVHSWNSIKDYGSITENEVAYETGNDEIALGEPDNKTLGSSDATAESGGSEGVRLTDDESDDATGTEKFLYSSESYEIGILVAANTNVMKQVKAEDDADYSYSTTVYAGGTYSYRVRFANDSVTVSDHIVLMDSIENFYQYEGDEKKLDSEWYGTLTGIDYSQITAAGADVTVYVSTVENLNLNTCYDDTTGEVNLSDTGIWQTLEDYLATHDDLSGVKAIALDCSKATDGSDFLLGAGESLTFTYYMQAPDTITSTSEDPVTYGNIFASRTAYMVGDDGEVDKTSGASDLCHQDYTQLRYRVVADVELTKVSAEDSSETIKGSTWLLSGTSDYDTVYSETVVSNKKGEVTFENIEKGTYELVETAVGDDWQLRKEIYTVVVANDGTVTISGGEGLEMDANGDYLVTDEPRIHGDLSIIKKDSLTDVGLEGAEFKLSGKSDYGNDVLMYATSGTGGSVEFDNLELGTYTMVETAAPEDHILRSDITWTVQVDETGEVTLTENVTDTETGETTSTALSHPTDENGMTTSISYTVANEPLHEIQFVKTSTYGENIYISGVVFTLTGTSDYGTVYDGTNIATSAETTGVVTFEGLEPGTYTLKETDTANANDGIDGTEFEPDGKSYTVTVNADGTYTISGLSQITIDINGNQIQVYNFPNSPKDQTMTVKKIWLDEDNGASRTPSDIDITVQTEVPDASQWGGYTIIFDANGGTFGNSVDTKTVSYLSTYARFGSVSYSEPTSTDEYLSFVGWYTESGERVYLNSDGFPVTEEGGTTVKTSDFTNNELKLTAKWSKMTYAVKLYSLDGGTEEGNKNLGLTFGPAIGGDYVNSYVSHEVDDNGAITGTDAGKTSGDHAYRCIHQDSWSEIIAWNKTDPDVYEKCISNGCTKSIPLSTNTTTTILSSKFVGTYTGDGPGILYYELVNLTDSDSKKAYENLRYCSIAGECDWSTSRIRAMLNGYEAGVTWMLDGATSGYVYNDASNYTSTNCLLATFPKELQNAIGERTIETYAGYRKKTTTDKLWLMAYGGGNDSDSVWTAYGMTDSTSATDLRVGYWVDSKTGGSESASGNWWLRSSYAGNSKNARVVASGGSLSRNLTFFPDGVAPGFSLSRSN